MALSYRHGEDIKGIIKQSILRKLETYNPEPAYMPFHTALLGKDRLATYKFIQSLNTSFGTSIFEPLAVEIAKHKFKTAQCQVQAGSRISTQAQQEIQLIMDNLSTAFQAPHKEQEVENIRRVARSGEIRQVKPTRVDVLLESHKGAKYLIDIKTAKPNKGGFKEYCDGSW